jgi:hypothetical protein
VLSERRAGHGPLKGSIMDKPLEIENIEQRRCSLGIEDVELREAIRGLRVGDYVKLTILSDTKSAAGETLLVRITRISGSEFRGKLTDSPPASCLPRLRAGTSLEFTSDHIHSLGKGRLSRGT